MREAPDARSNPNALCAAERIGRNSEKHLNDAGPRKALLARQKVMQVELLVQNATTMRWCRYGASLFFVLAAFGLKAVAAPVASGPQATLIIRMENVLPGGLIRLGVYDEAHYPDDNSAPVASADTIAIPGETIITLHGLSPGIYAIETFQDVNANGKMDTSWIGIPLEPFGFSQDAVPFLSKPPFDEVKFNLPAGETSLTIHLQNSTRSSPADKARDAVHSRQRQ